MSNQSESTRINRDALARELEDMLRPFGLCYRYSGYAGFIDAILMAVENPQRLSCVSKEIYAPIAEKYGVNPINVERNIRTIRDVIMKNDGARNKKKLSGCRRWYTCHPYPGELLEVISSYLRRRL